MSKCPESLTCSGVTKLTHTVPRLLPLRVGSLQTRSSHKWFERVLEDDANTSRGISEDCIRVQTILLDFHSPSYIPPLQY